MKKDYRKLYYLNSCAEKAIDECIHIAKHRAILKSRFLDGETFDELAEHYAMSDRQIRRIVSDLEDIVFQYIEDGPN